MTTQILANVFSDRAPMMASPVEFTFAEWEAMRDAVRHMRHSRPDWKMTETLQVAVKLAGVAAKVVEVSE